MLKRTGNVNYSNEQEMRVYQEFKKELKELENMPIKVNNKVTNQKQIDQKEEAIFKKYENILLDIKKQ